MSAYPTVPCRSCDGPIIWAVTKNGHPMPVDPVPVADGNIELQPRADRLLANVLRPRDAEGRDDLRQSHFRTCPDAARWRKEGRPA